MGDGFGNLNWSLLSLRYIDKAAFTKIRRQSKKEREIVRERKRVKKERKRGNREKVRGRKEQNAVKGDTKRVGI
jgi:hypothetical protein